jgi:Uncharacterized protein conserved in bacteria
MRHKAINRVDIFKYAKESFDTEPEYLWKKFPQYAVLRHKNNAKWYAVIMDILKQKLGLQGQEKVEILVVKCDPIMIGSLLQNEGYLPAYHMNKERWITILLDGSVPKDSVFDLLSLSYDLTSKQK